MIERISWGLFFIVAACILIASGLGFAPEIGFWTILLTILAVGALVGGICNRSWFAILVPIAFLCILYDDLLGITDITPWPVLGAAFLGSIGLEIIFRGNHNHQHVCNNGLHRHHHTCNNGETVFDETTDNVSGSIIDMRTTFGSSTKYINADAFEAANIQCSFGEIKVYFDNAIMKNGVADINLDVSFAGTELYIPKTWRIENNARASFGAIEFKNGTGATDGPVIRINGYASFGAVEIFCI